MLQQKLWRKNKKSNTEGGEEAKSTGRRKKGKREICGLKPSNISLCFIRWITAAAVVRGAEKGERREGDEGKAGVWRKEEGGANDRVRMRHCSSGRQYICLCVRVCVCECIEGVKRQPRGEGGQKALKCIKNKEHSYMQRWNSPSWDGRKVDVT